MSKPSDTEENKLQLLEKKGAELDEKMSQILGSIMGLRGELNIMSDQWYSAQRKAEEAIITCKGLDEKASKDDLVKVNSRFKDFVANYEYKTMVEKVETLASKQELIQTEQKIDDLKPLLDDRYTKTQVDEIIEQLGIKLKAHIAEKYCSIELFDQEAQAKNNSLQLLSKNSSNYEELLKELSQKFWKINQQLISKADAEEVKAETEKIWKNFENWWQYEHIKQIKYKIEPLAEDWLKRINHFKKDNQEMKEIINRFDEILLEKASKFSLTQLREKFQEYATEETLQTLKKHILKYQREFEEKVDEIEEAFEQKFQNVLDDVQRRTDHGLAVVKKQVLDAMGGKPVDVDELCRLLAIKADKSEIGILSKLKSDRSETSHFQNSVDFLTSQFENMLALQIESLKSDIPSGGQSEHSKINNKASILNQMMSLYKWGKTNKSIQKSISLSKDSKPNKLKLPKRYFINKRDSAPVNQYTTSNSLINLETKVEDFSQFENEIYPSHTSKLLQPSKSRLFHKSRLQSAKPQIRCKTSQHSRSHSRISSRDQPSKPSKISLKHVVNPPK